jgi:hypothetical protein
MDICMLTPSESAKLQDLFEEYDNARERALEYLQKIADEWDKEYHGQTKEWAETPHGQWIWKRLATIEEWVILIDIDRIQISDIEPKAE